METLKVRELDSQQLVGCMHMPIAELAILFKDNLVSHCQTKVLFPHTLHICLVVLSIKYMSIKYTYIDIGTCTLYSIVIMFTHAHITYPSPFL